MKTRKNSHKVPGKHRFRAGKAALPALVAAGGGLAVGSAAALELGELQVQSTLGQPLRASIAYGDRRSRFASAVTHELRTPLTTFRMYAEMLAEGMIDDPD